jgi:hypothetical protein
VYYLRHPRPSLKNWWVVYKVNPKIHTHRYDEYIEGHEDDDIYQEEIEIDQNLLDEEAGPSNKYLQKSKHLLKRQERRE